MVDGHSYVRQQRDYRNDYRVQSVQWHLNEVEKEGTIYLEDDMLEELFWKNNGKSNNRDEETIPAPEKVENSKLETIEIEVPDGKQIIRTDLEDGVLITFEDTEKEEYITSLNGDRYFKVMWEEEFAKFADRLKNGPIYCEIHHLDKNFGNFPLY